MKYQVMELENKHILAFLTLKLTKIHGKNITNKFTLGQKFPLCCITKVNILQMVTQFSKWKYNIIYNILFWDSNQTRKYRNFFRFAAHDLCTLQK